MKTLFLSTVLFSLIVPSVVSAQIDPRCFTRDECTRARQEMLGQPVSYAIGGAESGFYSARDHADAADACKGTEIWGTVTDPASGVQSTGQQEAGFCLPVTQAETTIQIGGETRFGRS